MGSVGVQKRKLLGFAVFATSGGTWFWHICYLGPQPIWPTRLIIPHFRTSRSVSPSQFGDLNLPTQYPLLFLISLPSVFIGEYICYLEIRTWLQMLRPASLAVEMNWKLELTKLSMNFFVSHNMKFLYPQAKIIWTKTLKVTISNSMVSSTLFYHVVKIAVIDHQFHVQWLLSCNLWVHCTWNQWRTRFR